jgi:alpha-D-xyloside xylohydrolase
LRLGGTAVAALAFPGSTGGAGCQADDTSPCSFPALGDRIEVCMKGARLEENIYVGGFPETQSAFLADVGKPVLPPPSQFALIKWRDEVSGPRDLLEDVQRLRSARIPVGWVLLDNPWEPCVGAFKWDTSRIPDPAGLIRELHRQSVRLMLWISPDNFCASPGYPPQGLIDTPVGRELDLTSPAVVAEFKRRLRSVLALGVDGVKGDRGDEGNLEPRSVDLHNRYPLLFAQAATDVLRALRGNDFATIFRAAGPGEQRFVPGFWNGDQPGDFTGLQRTILQGATAGIAGFSVWGSDIGGYASAQLTPEVFARWAQLGAVSPVFEVGGVGPNATPWLMGNVAMDALRAAAVLHYELFPYFYGLVRAGVPVLRPLAYGFPQDQGSWLANYELLVGDNLLAAPVIGPGTTPSVYLPPGQWVDLYAGTNVNGPGVFTRPTPLDQLPLYLRAGSVIPFNLRTASKSLWSLEQLTSPGRAGFLATNGAELKLSGLPALVQVFVPSAARPGHVTIGGRRVAFSWEAGPMPGVVVRLTGPALKGRIVLAQP